MMNNTQVLRFVQPQARACACVPLTETLSASIQASHDCAQDENEWQLVCVDDSMRDELGWNAGQLMRVWPDGLLSWTDTAINMDDALCVTNGRQGEYPHVGVHTPIGRLVYGHWEEQFLVAHVDGDAHFSLESDTYDECVHELLIEYGMTVDDISLVHAI